MAKKKRVSKKMQKQIDARRRREQFYADRSGPNPKVEVKSFQTIDPNKGSHEGNLKPLEVGKTSTRTAGDAPKPPKPPKMKKVEADGWSPDGGKTWLEYGTGNELKGFDKDGNKMVPAQKNPAAYKMKGASVPGVFKQGVKGLKK